MCVRLSCVELSRERMKVQVRSRERQTLSGEINLSFNEIILHYLRRCRPRYKISVRTLSDKHEAPVCHDCLASLLALIIRALVSRLKESFDRRWCDDDGAEISSRQTDISSHIKIIFLSNFSINFFLSFSYKMTRYKKFEED